MTLEHGPNIGNPDHPDHEGVMVLLSKFDHMQKRCFAQRVIHDFLDKVGFGDGELLLSDLSPAEIKVIFELHIGTEKDVANSFEHEILDGISLRTVAQLGEANYQEALRYADDGVSEGNDERVDGYRETAGVWKEISEVMAAAAAQ